MIPQELQLTNTIHRFELTVNSSGSAFEKAFSLYGILIIPSFLGIDLIYNVLRLREESLWITIIVLVMILINIYFFYQKRIIEKHRLKLLIYNGYIRIRDNQKIYFKEEFYQINIKPILCGKKLQPALQLNSKSGERIIIGLKHIKLDVLEQSQNQLSQPDYWLSNQYQTQSLMKILKINTF